MPKFKIVAGKHSQKEEVKDEAGKTVKGSDGKAKTVVKRYVAGDTFESQHDLVKLFNSAGAIKFEYVPEAAQTVYAPAQAPKTAAPAAPAPAPLPNFDAMTVKELLAYAADEEIDVKGETRKDKLVELLKTKK